MNTSNSYLPNLDVGTSYDGFSLGGNHTIVYLTVMILLAVVPARFVLKSSKEINKINNERHRLAGVPVINDESDVGAADRYKYDAKNIFREGYERYREKIYQMWTPDGWEIIIPRRFIDHVKNLPNDILDFAASRGLGQFKFVILRDDFLFSVIRKNMTKDLSPLMPGVNDEIKYCFDNEMPTSKEWTRFKAYPNLLRTIAIVSSRIFVGPTLSRNEEWLHTVMYFTLDVFTASEKLAHYPAFLRPIVQWFIPEVYRAHRHRKVAQKLVKPIIEERLKKQNDPNWEKPFDSLQWLLDECPKVDDPPPIDKIPLLQLSLSLAGVHTTTMGLTHAVYDLASHPECIEPIREEVESVLAEEPDGEMTYHSTNKMLKLDSFVKESQRMSPPMMVSFDRNVTQQITFPDGTVVPPHSKLVTPSYMISHDPEIWPNPDEFDGFRFSRLRTQSKENINRYTYATSAPDQMHFGAGKHLCPGRYFAGTELKVWFAYLVKNFDFQLENPEEGRPKNKEFLASIQPDREAHILLKRKSDG